MDAMKKRFRKLALPAALLVGGAIWLASGQAEQAAATVSKPALTVRTTTLQPAQWARNLTANGSIVPWQEAIISAQLQGVRIAEVKVSLGDRVKQGDVLVVLDNLVHGKDEPAHSAQGQVIAPDDGVISVANATVGSMVQPGGELFRLIRQGRFEWRAELTADELMLIRKGMNVEIVVGEGRVIKGNVRAISPSVNLQTRYGTALVSLHDSNGLVGGAFARGTFDIGAGKRGLLSLPQSAVLQRGTTAFVLLVGANDQVHERVVVTGQRIGDRVEIKQGLKSDEVVVESGGSFLTEGDYVKVVKG